MHGDLGIFQVLSDHRSLPFVNFMVVLHIGVPMVVGARMQKSAKIFELHKIKFPALKHDQGQIVLLSW